MRPFQKEWAKIKEFFFKKNIKWNIVIRSTIYVICCGVMFYQVSSSCMEYYKYNTVVQIKISKPEQQSMPAVSVCKQITVTEYLALLRKHDEEFAKNWPAQSHSTMAGAGSETGPGLSEEADEERQWDELMILANYFKLEGRDSGKLFGVIKESLKIECQDVRTGTGVDCNESAYPINSFTQKRICITYFSKLYKNFNFSENNFNISENGTNEKEEDKESLFVWFKIENPTNDVFVYIHTHKSMPDINLYDLEMTRSRLFNNKTYGIIYSKNWVQRLEAPYSTNCDNYRNKRASEWDPLSEFGCINRCKKRFWRTETEDPCIPIDLVYILESEDYTEKICNCTVKPCDKTMNKCEKCNQTDSEEYKKWSKDCENNCLQDCYEEYYNKDMFELQDDFRNKIWQKYEIKPEDVTPSQTLVFLAAKYHEEVSYTHVPKTSQFDFFAMLGGLFSLWIGASVLTVYDVLEVLLKCAMHLHSTFKKTKNKFGERSQNPVKVRGDIRINREIYGSINSGRVRKLVTMPSFY